jgi:peptidoglycan/xylan/chitin deacetylase (PgdA/CDA1 family)
MKKFLLLLCSALILFGCNWTTHTPKSELVVSINFDDNCSSVYAKALPAMQQYGFRGTHFVNSGKVGNPGRLTWAQLDSLKHFYQWEIGGHSLNHLNLATLSEQQAEISISADYDSLSRHNLHPVSFATPFGYCPVEFYSHILQYYKNIRTCFNTAMHCPIDQSLLGAFSVTNEMSVQDVMDRVDQAQLEGENLVILLFHEVGGEDTDYLSNCDPDIFAEIMRRLHQSRLKVLPLNEALNYLSD